MVVVQGQGDGSLRPKRAHTAYWIQGYQLVDSPLLGFAQEYELPLMIHAEGPGSDNASPEDVFRLAAAKPGVRMCIAHICYFDKTLLPQCLEYPNVYVGVAPWVRSVCSWQ